MMGSQMNIETEGRLRYKILTNFVNAYKDKMFLSNSPGKGGDGGGADIMTLEDLKAHTQAERSDIKLDFEQFMRIFSFEKNRSTSNVTPKILSPVNKDAQYYTQAPASARKTPSPQRGKCGKGAKTVMNSHQKGSYTNIMNEHSPSSRPISQFGQEIFDQKKKLMSESRDIRKSLNQNKSLIEAARLKKKAE